MPKIAEAFSRATLDRVIESEEIMSAETERLPKSEIILKCVVYKIGESVKQEVYDSLSYDQKCLQDNCPKLSLRLEKLVAELDRNRLMN